MSKDVAQDALALAQLAELSHRLLSATETMERLTVGITNHVLFAGSVTLDSTGQYTFQWQARCGAIEITNPDATQTLKVVPTAGGNDTYQGPGVHYVQPATYRVLNMDSQIVTITGTANKVIGVQAFTIGGIFGQGKAV